MKLYQAIVNLLNKPFPEQETYFGSPRTLLIISLFITLFLYIFQPFGISTLESHVFLTCLGFGSMTLVASVLFGFLIGPLMKPKGQPRHWTFGKWILNNLGLLLTISLANFLFARLVLIGFIDWSLFPDMIYGTFMVGIIPITVLGGLSLRILEKRYQGIAQHINSQTGFTEKTTQLDEPTLYGIPVSRIKYVEALQNYVTLGYLDDEDQFQKITERSTLKQVMQVTQGSSIVQSHRSFLVNRNAIQSTAGNAQGLVLTLTGCDHTIPVSRSFIPSFRTK